MHSPEGCIGGCILALPFLPAVDNPLVVAINCEWHAGVVDGVMVQGPNLIFSIVHFSPLLSDSPFTFTVSIMFSTDNFRYMVQ